jgi:glucose-1-phosphatase
MTLLFIFDMDDVLYGYDWTARSEALAVLTGLR